jgi:hypothetical protein
MSIETSVTKSLRLEGRSEFGKSTLRTHHATGVRVRELPVKIEDLLTSSVLG